VQQAVDGKSSELSWDGLVAAGDVHADAAKEAQWASEASVPTLCRKTGSFSPHLTLAAVGCALSHRAAWQRLASQQACDWALFLEDDVDSVAAAFDQQLQVLLRALPLTWRMCYLGYHESANQLLSPSAQPTLCDAPEGSAVTGLFGYLLRRSAAEELLADTSLFPLRHQIDVVLSRRKWKKGSRFALSPDGVLLTSPRSEDGKCDTDVQTLGEPEADAHLHLPKEMLRL